MNPRHVTAAFASAYIHYVTEGRVTLTVNRLRVWAHRGKIQRVGTDHDGYALYDLDDVIKEARRRVALDPL
jgi:hypothetical protein